MPARLALRPQTHDVSRTGFHHQDLEQFAQIESSLNATFFPNASRNIYKEVHVLMLSWEGGDTVVHDQLISLQGVFRDEFQFQTEDWLIPSARCYRELDVKLSEFLKDYDAVDNLLLIYYGGHGCLDEDRSSLWMR